MDDIAKEMAMSKKTLYKYFENKEELVYEVSKQQIVHNECQCMGTCDMAENAIHELILMMIRVRELFKGMNPSVMFDLQKYYPKAWKVMEQHKHVFIKQMIEENLRRGIEEGLYRDDINVGILAKLRIEEIKLSFNPEIFGSYNMEDVQVTLLEHFMLGITTIKGHELANDYKKLKNE